MSVQDKRPLQYGLGCAVIGLVVFGLFFLVNSGDSFRLYGLLSEREPLSAAEFETSPPGEIVLLSVTIDEDNETEYEDIVLGCVDAWDDSEDGSWVLDHYLPEDGEPVRVHLGEKQIFVYSPGNCPSGEYKDEEGGPAGLSRYRGYQHGQQVSLLVEIVRSDEWVGGDTVSIVDGGAFGGTPEEQQEQALAHAIGLAVAAVVSGVVVLFLVWTVLKTRRRLSSESESPSPPH